jgi:spore germination protein GerM
VIKGGYRFGTHTKKFGKVKIDVNGNGEYISGEGNNINEKCVLRLKICDC